MTFVTTPFVRSFVGFDTLFDELERVSNFKEASYPAFNIEKIGENSYEIALALAGFQEDQLNLELKQNVLTLEGKNGPAINSRNYLHKGIATRAFSKQFRLAENVEVESATFSNGMLVIKLFKNVPEEELPTRIEINSENNILRSVAS